MSALWTRCPLLVILAILGAVYALGLQPVHGWADDASLYLQQALNLIAGRPVDWIGFERTQAAAHYYTVAFPLLLPAMLAPVVVLAGLNFVAFKALMLVLFLLALWASWEVLKDWVGEIEGLAAVAVMGVNFHCWVLADHINSDYLFLLLACTLLWWIQRQEQAPGWWKGAIVAGTLIGMAELARTVAIVLPPMLVAYSLVRYRRLTPLLAASAALGAVLIGLLKFAGWAGGDYVASANELIGWRSIRSNLIRYPLDVSDMLGGKWLAVPIVAAAAYGAWRSALWKQLPFLFVAAYGGLIILWPPNDTRYAFPLLPFVLGMAIHAVGMAAGARCGPALLALLAAGVLWHEIPQHAALRRDGYRSGMTHPNTMELYQAIREKTPQQARIAGRKVRSISLMTGRRGIVTAPLPEKTFVADLCASQPTHLVYAPTVFEDDEQWYRPVVEARRQALELIFRSGGFELYSIHPGFCRP